MDCEFVFSSINQTGPGGGAHITKAYFDDPIICIYIMNYVVQATKHRYRID
jgi:hypothetical protein